MKPLNRLAWGIGRLYGRLGRSLTRPDARRSSRRAFVIGAGFSKELSQGRFPIMSELGNQMLKELPFLSKYHSDGEQFDLETVLTRLDFEITQQQSATAEELGQQIDQVRDFLRNRLSLAGVSDQAKAKAKSLCSALFRPGDTIVTFNYDCLLEHILWQLGSWSPCGGYGSAVGLDPCKEYGSTIPGNPEDITILKLHGSLNFSPPLVQTKDPCLNAVVNEELFPNSSAHLGNIPQFPPVALPSYLKPFGETRTMVHLWHDAAKRISEADVLILLGYSMPTTPCRDF